MDPAADIDGLAIRVIDPNASLAPGYPQDDSSVAIAACELHDPGGYWFEIDRAVDEWEDWLRHLAEKVWRGDVALRKLVHPAG